MQHTINHQKGFTLIEVAVVIAIIGIVMAPALALYQRKLDADRVKQSYVSIERAEKFISAFRNMYGRYPCPAPMDARPGDANYGYEDCAATIPGVVTALSNNTAIAATPDILIGSLPFRQTNMQEQDSFDAYGNRYTYAVTRILTDADTFEPDLGGVSIIDVNGNNALSTPHSAQFVILSHGESQIGAMTRDGVRVGACATGEAQDENCNDDAVFMQGNVQVGFDDLMIHASKALISPWKYSDVTQNDVILTDVNKFGIGIQDAIELTSGSGASELTILESSTGDAVIHSSGGAMISDNICDYGDTGCFTPRLISGFIGSTGGMTCNPASEFFVGIRNGAPVCETTLTFECAAGQYMAGFDASTGKLLCAGIPAPSCVDEVKTTSCGTTETLSGTYDSGYSSIESGMCYELNNFSSATAAAQPDIASIVSYVDGLNTASRTGVPCTGRKLVRDNYRCDAGTWTANPVRSHELWNYMGSFPSDPAQNSRIATTNATGAPAYSQSGSLTANDCWCREEYRVNTWGSCSGGLAGTRVRVQKHRCPQTRGTNWQTIYDDNTTFCACVDPGPQDSMQSCESYYGVPNGSMSGDVTTTSDDSCSGGVLVADPSPTVTDNCTCEDNAWSPYIDTIACPSGTTNSFSYGGVNYTGVREIRQTTWSCPNGFGNSVSSAAEAGSWSPYVTVHTEACTCNSTLTDTVTEACPSGYSGSGRQYLREWDCTIPGWEPQADWDLISDACTQCTWKKPSTSPSSSATGIGNEISTGGCACGTTGLCYERAGMQYDNYTSCSCQP